MRAGRGRVKGQAPEVEFQEVGRRFLSGRGGGAGSCRVHDGFSEELSSIISCFLENTNILSILIDMRSTCSHVECMTGMIQIRNVPDDLHRKLKARAALEGRSLSDYLLQAISDLAARPSVEEWRARLHTREPVDLGDETVEFLRAERDAR